MEKESKGDYQAILDSALSMRDVCGNTGLCAGRDSRNDDSKRSHTSRVMQAVEFYHNNVLQSAKSLSNSSNSHRQFDSKSDSEQYSRHKYSTSGETNGNRIPKSHIHSHPQNISYSIIGCNNAYHNYDEIASSKCISRKCDHIYCSNTSLDLDSNVETEKPTSTKREYGSHGSLHLPSGNSSYFNVANNFESTQYLHSLNNKPSDTPPFIYSGPVNENNNNTTEIASPKPKVKFSKFWDSKEKSRTKGKIVNSEPFHFWKSKTNIKFDSNLPVNKIPENGSEWESKIEEKVKRKGFSHYDCQSVTVNLSCVSKLQTILAKRRNTTTGASAASVGNRVPFDEEEKLNSVDIDPGDGKSNDILQSCPFFRNELGGEEERNISLSRNTFARNRKYSNNISKCIHRPVLAYGIGILEYPPGQTHWTMGLCPFIKNNFLLESFDDGASYYKEHFFNQEHQNWVGMDDNLGPIAISIKREKAITEDPNKSVNYTLGSHYIYRIIIRTSELATLRGSILEESIPTIKPSTFKGISAKEVIEHVAPEIQSQCLKLASSPQTEGQLLKLDQQGISHNYKVGVMYCKAGQSTEEEMYNNEDAGPAFSEFLDLIGEKIKLKDFDHYRAGLDNKTDSTGTYSIYSRFKSCEVMFHVSTMLPFTPNNRQQLLRKRHIGNDIVTIIFQEPGAKPFTPKTIRSHFQHVFIIVKAIDPCSSCTRYRVAVSRSKEVAVFGPPIPDNATFPKSEAFRDFLLQKVINAENAAHRAEKFSTMATRTRQEYLKELAANHVTNTPLETTTKFSLMGFTSKKKEKSQSKGVLENMIRGAITWSVQTKDCCQNLDVDSILAVSHDSLVIIESATKEVLFVTPCQSILGWNQESGGLRVYFHQGESIFLYLNDESDDITSVIGRLKFVSRGTHTQDLTLKRNSIGQLGFHVQHDGLVTEVEPGGPADLCGLKQGCRLVEICKIAVATLSHEQMVDLLKTSEPVIVSVIPPVREGVPRRGCNFHACPYPNLGYEGDYENLYHTSDFMGTSVSRPQTKRSERTSSPPRSSNSSGYGTGSSSKSFTYSLDNSNVFVISGVEEKWNESLMKRSPPPLPARSRNPYLRPQDQIVPSTYFCTNLNSNTITNSYPVSVKVESDSSSREELAADVIRGIKNRSKIKPYIHNDNRGTLSPPEKQCNSDDSDISSSSNTVTPNLDKRKETSSTTSSASTSGTHSPRLKVGISQTKGIKLGSSYPSSSIQEDLIKLINPDLNTSITDESKGYQLCQSHSMTSIDSQMKSPGSNDNLFKSLTIGEGLDQCWKAKNRSDLAHKSSVSADTGFSTSQKVKGTSPDYLENLQPEDKFTNTTETEPLPLPDTHNMDWPTLVDTATKAIQQIQSYSSSETSDWLQCQLQEKENENALLQYEVENLKTENKRLLEENQKASRQIRDITSWILSNPENHSPHSLHKVQLLKYPCDN